MLLTRTPTSLSGPVRTAARSRLRTLFLAASLVCLPGAIGEATTEAGFPQPRLDLSDGTLDLGLTLYWGGLKMAEIDANTSIGMDRYGIGFTFRTAGVLSWMVDATSRVEATGDRAEDGSLVPREMQTRSVFDGKERRLRINFDENGATTEIDIWREEGFDPTKREAVPVDLRRGPDPVSVIFVAGLMRDGGLPAGERTFRTFDGKRAMSFTLDCSGDEVVLQRSGLSAYHGPAVKCSVSGEQVAGFHKEYRKRNIELDRPASVWFARADGRDLYLPVRFEMQTQYGSIVGHVSRLGPPPATE